MASYDMVTSGKWFRMMCHRAQEHKNNITEIMGFRGKLVKRELT